MDVLDNLELDTWFKAVTYIGGICFVFGLFIPTEVVSNKLVVLLGAGLLSFGLGRWKNYKTFTGIQNQGFGGIMKVSTKKRSVDLVGAILEIVGILLILYTIWLIVGPYL